MIEQTKQLVDKIKRRLVAAQHRQKDYADLGIKDKTFEIGEKVLLKVSPWKGIVRFGRRKS